VNHTRGATVPKHDPSRLYRALIPLMVVIFSKADRAAAAVGQVLLGWT